MDKPKTYCEAVETMDKDNVHRIYHDTAYGYPINDDNELFERLILEINQAGSKLDDDIEQAGKL